MKNNITILTPQNVNSINKKLNKDIPISEVFKSNKYFREDINTILRKSKTKEITNILKTFGIEPLSPGYGDKISTFIMGAEGKAIAIIALGFLIIGLLPALSAMIEGNFWKDNSSSLFSTIEDIGYWNQYIIAMPITALVTSMYFSRLPKTLIELVLQGTFPVTRSQWNDFVIKISNRVYGNWFVKILPYITGFICAITLSHIYLFEKSNYWNNISFANNTTKAGWLLVPDIFFLYTLISLAVLRVIITSYVLIKFFNFTPDIQPLHPDSSGGLSPLGKLSSTLNLGTFLYGLLSVVGIYANNYNYSKPIYGPENITIMVAYVLCASIIFFLPLLSAHSCMKEAKYNTIQTINQRFETLNKQLIKSLDKNDKLSKENIEDLKSLKDIHEIASKMPVYPFDTETVTRFIGSILIPILVYILTNLIDKFFIIK